MRKSQALASCLDLSYLPVLWNDCFKGVGRRPYQSARYQQCFLPSKEISELSNVGFSISALGLSPVAPPPFSSPLSLFPLSSSYCSHYRKEQQTSLAGPFSAYVWISTMISLPARAPWMRFLNWLHAVIQRQFQPSPSLILAIATKVSGQSPSSQR